VDQVAANALSEKLSGCGEQLTVAKRRKPGGLLKKGKKGSGGRGGASRENTVGPIFSMGRSRGNKPLSSGNFGILNANEL